MGALIVTVCSKIYYYILALITNMVLKKDDTPKVDPDFKIRGVLISNETKTGIGC